MPRTHGANKSIVFAQILDPYEVTLSEFAQIKCVLFAHVYKALAKDLSNHTFLQESYAFHFSPTNYSLYKGFCITPPYFFLS